MPTDTGETDQKKLSELSQYLTQISKGITTEGAERRLDFVQLQQNLVQSAFS